MTEQQKQYYMAAMGLWVCLALLSITDYFTTTILLDMGATEVNPILAELIERTNTVQVILYMKVFFLLMLVIVLIPKHITIFVLWFMFVVVVAYLVVVVRSVNMLSNLNIL